jgi:hypothetical protein
LAVGIDQHHIMALPREFGAQVNGGGGLAAPAFLAAYQNNHGRFFSVFLVLKLYLIGAVLVCF